MNWKIVIVLSGALLASCGTVPNPLTQNELATAESGYGVLLAGAVAYKHLPLCKTGTSISLTNVCARRSVIVKLQQADRAVQAALVAARSPTVNAAAMLALQAALAQFQQIEVANGIGQ